MTFKKPRQLFLILLCATASAWAQSQNTENTLKLDPGAKPPPATLDGLDWLVGSWTGEAFGGTFEESWSRPSAGTMVSTFKLIHDGRPSMYEFQMLVEEDDSLTLKLKHFNADFSGWEEKDEFVSFPLVELSDDGAWFGGLTYKRLGPNRLEVFVAIGEGNESSEERLLFVRAGSGETAPAAVAAESEAQPVATPTSPPPTPPSTPDPPPDPPSDPPSDPSTAPPSEARSDPPSALPTAPASLAEPARIYVGNLPLSATAKQIQEVFERYGTVSSIRLVTDPDTGRSRGFAYVEMAEGAEAAIEALDGGRWGRRLLTVEDAGERVKP